MNKPERAIRAKFLAVSTAVLFGSLATGGCGEEAPVNSSKVAALTLSAVRNIAKIPVTEQEIRAVRSETQKDFTGAHAIIHTDNLTGQPYHIPNVESDPLDVQVVRIISTKDRGTYNFTINERRDSKGNLNPDQTSFLGTQVATSDFRKSVSVGLYDLQVPTLGDSADSLVARGDSWGAEGIVNSLIRFTVGDDVNRAITPYLFTGVSTFVNRAVAGAAGLKPVRPLLANTSFEG